MDLIIRPENIQAKNFSLNVVFCTVATQTPDTATGRELVEFYQHNNLLYGDSTFTINALNQRGERWLDKLI